MRHPGVRVRRSLGLTTIVVLAAACLTGQRGTAPARHVVLQDSVYLANMVVAQTHDGAVVIDNTMFRDVTTAFLDSATRTLRDTRVALLINSHGHDDHTWGNQVFADRGVPIAAHPATIVYMTGRIDEMRVFRERGPVVVDASRDSLASADSTTAARLRARIDRVTTNLDRHRDLRVTVPTIAIGRDSSWRIGGARVHVLVLGVAHSTGDLAVLLPDHGIAVVGDLIGSDELPGLNRDGDLAGWVAALERINIAARDLRITRVIPGRGPVTAVAALACNRAYLEALRQWAQSAEPTTLAPAREAARCGLRLDSARHENNSAAARTMRAR
jgi:cyclase